MHTLTIKIPPALEQDIARASAREHLSKSELVRRAFKNLGFAVGASDSQYPAALQNMLSQPLWA